ncbi:MAG: large conductance mechanosensitive channel protein MscL [Lachnospiraceae bacterium]|nr:large conductance mechanosensitive channel protein MscL [Lachnospiraceae bacterium]
MKKLLTEFKEFALKGRVVDMAIGVIIGGAFTAIVTSLTDSFINPLINSIGGAEVAGAIRLPWVDYTGLDSEAAMALSLNYGAFVTAVINFLIVAVILFIMLKAVTAATKAAEEAAKKLSKKKEEEEAEAPTTKICPFCKSEINIEATKCPHCTSDQPAEEAKA